MSTGMIPGSRAEAGVSVREEFSGSEIMRQAETSTAMVAAQQKALIEARFVVAYRMGRNIEQLRQEMNLLCKNPMFAETAMYLKPVSTTPQGWKVMPQRERLIAELEKRDRNRTAKGDDNEQEWPMGFSIRFIEAAIAAAGSIDVTAMVIWEDELKRISRVDVTDLVKNNSFSRTVVTSKTVERRYARKGADPIATRYNSFGDLVYIYEATEAEVLQTEAANVSKSIRTLAEKLFPGHLKLEWRQTLEATIMDRAAEDPAKAKKEILDAFMTVGVNAVQIEEYLEHPLDQGLQPAEYLILRTIYSSMRGAEVTWAQVIQSKFGPAEGEAEDPAAKRMKALLIKKQADAVAAKQQQAKTAQPVAVEGSAGSAGTSGSSGSTGMSGSSAEGKPAPETSQAPKEQEQIRGIRTYKASELPDAEDFKVGTKVYVEAEGGPRLLEVVAGAEGEMQKWRKAEAEEKPADKPVESTAKPADKPAEKQQRNRNPKAFEG